jgi:prophage regulatory protein
LIQMWSSGKRLDGKPLSQFETQALAERWCAVFGELPPDDDDADDALQEPNAPEPELPADDTMLRAKDVVRLTGLSLSTLKRMVLDGRFAKPMRLSPRRIGWPARDVKAWLDGLDGARQKARL